MSDQSGGDKERKEGAGNHKRASAAALVEAFARQYGADREESKRTEKHRIFREWLTIAGLFLAAGVAFFQWRELRSTDHNIAEQARTASEQLKEIRESGKQTEKTIAAFERMADATKQHVDVASQTAERQLRAYLSVEPSSQVTVGGNGVIVRMFFKNAGLTPAHNVRVMLHGLVVKLPVLESHSLKGEGVAPETRTVIMQGEELNVNFTWQLTKEEAALAREPDRGLVVCGTVEYTDSFEKQRATQACGGVLVSALRGLASATTSDVNVAWKRVHDKSK